MRTLILLVVTSCASCVGQWPNDTKLTATTSRAGMPLEAWSNALDNALSMWQTEVGDDCPIGLVHEQNAADARPIELVAPADWTHGYDVIGRMFSDHIEIYGTSPDDTADYTYGTLVHELGHALAGPDHSSNPIDIMSKDGGTGPIVFTTETVNRVRVARGCIGQNAPP